MHIISVNNGSPAEKAGVKAGDVIVEVSTDCISALNIHDVSWGGKVDLKYRVWDCMLSVVHIHLDVITPSPTFYLSYCKKQIRI